MKLFSPLGIGARTDVTRSLAMLLVCGVVVSACSHTPRLTVNVATGLVPGPEFSYAVTEIFDARPAAEGAEAIARAPEVLARITDSYSRGKEVAAFDGLPTGEVVVRIRLLRPDHSVLIERRTRVTLNNDFVLTVHLTRDCVNVTCPAPGGSPAFTECLAGECVDPRCAPPATEFCPAAVFCHADAECSARSSCATAVCASSICEEVADNAMCSDVEYCNPDFGCQLNPTLGGLDAGIDASLADASLGDAATDAATDATTDAGDAGPIVCNTVCSDLTQPCYLGVWDCSGESPVCAPTWARRAGASCGANRVCNGTGTCIDCAAGAACLYGCSNGTLSCGGGVALCTPDAPETFASPGTSCADSAPYVCTNAGICAECVTGVACNVGCDTGVMHCEAGPMCVLNGGHLATGATCDAGDGMESHCTAAHTCVNCASGTDCDTGTVCRAGEIDCSAGAPMCTELGYDAPGVACATGVCSGAGACFTAFNALSVSAGTTHTCAVRSSDHQAYCWGGNDRGEVGTGSIGDAPLGTKTMLPGFASVVGLRAALNATLAYGALPPLSGTPEAIYAYGANEHGQLATGNTMDALAPSTTLLQAFKPIAYNMGNDFGALIDENRFLYTWGRYARTGLGVSAGDALSPQRVYLSGGLAADIAVGARHACAMEVPPGSRVFCWGDGESGQLGDASTVANSLSAVPAFGINDAVDIAAGEAHSCAVRTLTTLPGSARDAWCWGRGTEGQLGATDAASSSIPRQVPLPFTNVVAIEAGAQHTCVIRGVSGEVWCWGRGSEGQLGRGTTPALGAVAQVPGITNATQISLGAQHTCALVSSGALYCWGDNSRAQLGDGTNVRRTSPVLVRSN